MAKNVRASKEAKGVTLHIEHELAHHADAELLADCVQVLLDCAKTNGCFKGKLNITDACFNAIGRHNEESRCLSRAFGFA